MVQNLSVHAVVWSGKFHMSHVVKPRGAPSLETPEFGPSIWLEGVGSFDVVRSELSAAGADGRLDLVGSACGSLLALHGGH